MFEFLKDDCALCNTKHFTFFMNRKDNKYICKDCANKCLLYNNNFYMYSIEELKQSLKEEKSVKEIKQEIFIRQKQKDFWRIIQNIKFITPIISKEKVKRKYLKDIPDFNYSSIRKNTPPKKLENFVVIDTETTGLHPASDELLEISAIKFVNGNPIECLSTLVKPKKAISLSITQINNISNIMVQDSPCVFNIIDNFSSFIKGYNIVGYNLNFDLKFLHVNGMDFFSEKRQFYDVLQLCRNYFGKNCVKNFKLDTIAPLCDIYRPVAHRATEDALATGLLFLKIGSKLCNGERL